MNAHTDLIDRYFDAWNETDGARRRELIASTWASDADYRDPLMAGSGHDGIDAMIRAVQERFAGHTFRRSTEVDGFGTVDAHGRLQTVTGFLDQVPAGA
ncbi:MAG: hypothetical protein CPSOU_1866 [uncultured Paraburkholderia sp.]|nr:MAG: hypothetical protein CPSOU_1866 [uncultured Paraburkholderia sp.]